VASTHERGPKHAEASLKPTAREVAAPSRQPAAAQAEEELVHQSLLRVLDVQTNDLAELRASAGFSTTETPTLLTSTELDALLAERLQDPRIGDALLYLIGCYHRARQELASIQAARSQKMRENLSSVLPLLVAYARTCLCEPNLFVSAHTEQASASAYDYAATWFLNQFRQQSGDSSDASHVLSQAMYIDMVHWWAHDAPDELAQVLCLFFRKLVETARAELEQVLLQKAPSPWLQSLGAALNPPEALRIFVSMEDFVAGDTRTKIRSLLGPFLTPTALHYEDERVSRALFPNPMTNANHPMEQETITAVQWSLDTLRDGIYRLLLRLLRSGAEHRERVLTWMANQLNANTERMKIQAAESETSTDGYMLNLTDVLLRLAAPFADPRSSKLQNVSSRCLYDGHRVRLLDQETRVGCDQSQIQTWQADDSASPTEQGYSFVTECFFLTARSLQLTFLPFLQHYREDIMRQIQRLEEMKQELDMALQHPHPSIQHLEQQLMRSQCERALERLYRDRQSCHIYLLDSASLDRLLHFLGALSSYMMQLAGFHGTLPLPAEDTASVPRAYALLPESLFELIAEVLQTVTQLRLPVPLTTVAALFPHFVEFATMLLSNTHYLRNVHIRARYAEWLAQMFPAVGRELRNALGTVHLPPEFEAAFLGNEQVVGNLPPALMRLYIDVERTGTHTQFFDKFAMRFYMSEVLVAMWRVPAYEQTLRQLATSREDLFVHFSNMLFNDANFLLDETLQALTEIHELERILDQGSAEGQNLTAQTREEKRQRLLQLQRQARSFNQLANSSIRLMVTLTEEVRQPFLRPELLDRLTHMLNYFLVALCGPRCENLVVRDRQRYEWEPRQLLAQILRIYLFMYDPSRDLPGTKRFGSSIAADGRSYRPEVLERAAQIAEKRGLLTPAESARFRGLADLVETCAKEQVAEEEELGEVPEEFLDPILATIMQDPVLLPSSRKIVDRSTIVRHLLSDPHDPFNRQPLKGEDVIPQPALKQQIMDWLQQRQRR
jgi:ubiquitin conjugation factor E4 B